MKMKMVMINSILAGMCIGLGGVMFLSIDQKIIGALFFTLGLFTIVTRGFYLFTGRLGYAINEPMTYWVELAFVWIGNLIGTNLVAILIRQTRVMTVLTEKAAGICEVKLNDSLLSVFILGIFCNLLMYIAVDGFKKNPHEVGKYIGLFICVAGFILAGYEHCIANMFYFGMAGMWSAKAIIWLIAMTAGNIVGGLLIPAAEQIAAKA